MVYTLYTCRSCCRYQRLWIFNFILVKTVTYTHTHTIVSFAAMSFLCLCIRQKKVGCRAVHWWKSNKWNVHLFAYMKFFFVVLFYKQTEEGTVERPRKASVRLVHKTFLLSSLPKLWWNACASGNGFTAATRHGPWFSLDSQNIWTTFNFPCSFATTSPPHESCMYGHKEPPPRGDVQKILLHFLNKSRFIFIFWTSFSFQCPMPGFCVSRFINM